MMQINSQNVMPLIAAKQTERLNFLIMPCGQYDLRGWMAKTQERGVECLRKAAEGLCRGFAAVHSAGFLHNDVKPENIIYFVEEDQWKVSDLGLATHLTQNMVYPFLVGFTPGYRAPECYGARFWGVAADWWAVGVTLVEVATRVSPAGGEDDSDDFCDPFPTETIDAITIDGIRELLKTEPSLRLGGNDQKRDVDILKHPFISPPKEISCTACHKTFCSDFSLKRHVGRCEKLLEKASSGTWPCPLCDAKLAEKRYVRDHVRTQHENKDKRWPCNNCGALFKSKGHLNVHVRSRCKMAKI